MDSEGIDQAVLYPTIGLYFSVVEDPAAAVALAAAYNDWLAGYCAADPRRLFGAAMLPLQDPAAAARELRRAVGELGLVAGFVRPNPCLGRSLSDRAYDVVWEAAEELGVPIGIHEGSSVDRADPRVGPPLQPARPPRGVPLVRGDARLRRSSSPSGRSSATRGCASSSWSPPAAGRPSGWSAWTSRRSRSAASAPTWRCARRSTSPGSAPSASRSTSTRCRPWCRSSGARPHRLGQRLPAPRRHVPRCGRRHPGHRGPVHDRHPGARARAQRAPALPAPVATGPGCPGSSTTTSPR